jgi:ribosomal subunit interface protein
MDVQVRGRHDRVAEGDRARLEHKLSRLSRFDGRIDRIDVEVTFESRGRIGGGHRVEASVRSGRKVYRASANGPDVEAAVDRLVDRLERQIVEGHRRRRPRSNGGPEGVQSAPTYPNDREEGAPPASPI